MHKLSTPPLPRFRDLYATVERGSSETGYIYVHLNAGTYMLCLAVTPAMTLTVNLAVTLTVTLDRFTPLYPFH